MSTPLSRRSFLHVTGSTAALALVSPGLFAQTAPAAKAPSRPAALPADKVQAVVGESHRSLAAVRALVDETPLLANACWDWGGGDFETPLQAAAHTGQREIALYLLSRHARLDVFAAAMLGQLDFIKAAFALDPKFHEIPGPHGFTLLHCALRGGEPAAAVAAWMRAQGVPEETHRPLRFATPAS
jgi:hypothetical protein